ncbi:hypothetical protein containing C2H2 zinc finger motifs, degenerate [Pyrobaculum aerophilum str. IM2]|uniref:Uncharacterized protein n=1 Tax=Pyrobaculum aerophilum (strain ATCC 51768 / DSM 7523 / JCM 9630 / CIP 104966 / NBRC 100827 / IM2) TaxID=178306 RepID=Q8ZWN3_PYRAE|nr:hypothetical protein containing C2H2 zinc finger motifs, degenerate [Pyrobaculum aerophilum str. IM2]
MEAQLCYACTDQNYARPVTTVKCTIVKKRWTGGTSYLTI